MKKLIIILAVVLLLVLAIILLLGPGCGKKEGPEDTPEVSYESSGYQGGKYISLEAGFSVPDPYSQEHVSDSIEEDLVCAWSSWGGRIDIKLFIKKWPAAELLSKLVLSQGRRPAAKYRDWGIDNEQYFEINGVEAFRLKYILTGRDNKSVYCQESYFKRGPYLVDLQLKVASEDLKLLASGTSSYEKWIAGIEFFEPQKGDWLSADAIKIDELFRKFETALKEGDADEYLDCFHPEYLHLELEKQFMSEKVVPWNHEGASWALRRDSSVVNTPRANVVYFIMRFPPAPESGDEKKKEEVRVLKPSDSFKVEFTLRKDLEGWRIIDFK